MSYAALETYLSPIRALLEREGVSEVSINRPGEVWVEVRGDMYREEIPELTLDHLKSMAKLIAQSTNMKHSAHSKAPPYANNKMSMIKCCAICSIPARSSNSSSMP